MQDGQPTPTKGEDVLIESMSPESPDKDDQIGEDYRPSSRGDRPGSRGRDHTYSRDSTRSWTYSESSRESRFSEDNEKRKAQKDKEHAKALARAQEQFERIEASKHKGDPIERKRAKKTVDDVLKPGEITILNLQARKGLEAYLVAQKEAERKREKKLKHMADYPHLYKKFPHLPAMDHSLVTFHTQIKFVEEVLRPAGLMMTDQTKNGTGIMSVSAGRHPYLFSLCKLVILKKVKGGGFRGTLCDSYGNELISPDRPPSFDFALCLHEVTGAAGGRLGIKSMGRWPSCTGLLLVPVSVLLAKDITKEIFIPEWYYIAAENKKGECVQCGIHTMMGSDVPLLRCKMCKCASYCSITCQQLDWKEGHSRLCSNKALMKEARKGHWCLEYCLRRDELGIKHFPEIQSFVEDGFVASSWGSVMTLNSRAGSSRGSRTQSRSGGHKSPKSNRSSRASTAGGNSRVGTAGGYAGTTTTMSSLPFESGFDSQMSLDGSSIGMGSLVSMGSRSPSRAGSRLAAILSPKDAPRGPEVRDNPFMNGSRFLSYLSTDVNYNESVDLEPSRETYLVSPTAGKINPSSMGTLLAQSNPKLGKHLDGSIGELEEFGWPNLFNLCKPKPDLANLNKFGKIKKKKPVPAHPLPVSDFMQGIPSSSSVVTLDDNIPDVGYDSVDSFEFTEESEPPANTSMLSEEEVTAAAAKEVVDMVNKHVFSSY
jgi:hypothetical protein